MSLLQLATQPWCVLHQQVIVLLSVRVWLRKTKEVHHTHSCMHCAFTYSKVVKMGWKSGYQREVSSQFNWACEGKERGRGVFGRSTNKWASNRCCKCMCVQPQRWFMLRLCQIDVIMCTALLINVRSTGCVYSTFSHVKLCQIHANQQATCFCMRTDS